MSSPPRHPLVHLELHTFDRSGACAFYERLLHWRTEQIEHRFGTYHSMQIGRGLDGGIVECSVGHATWLPYAKVDDIDAMTERARRLGAAILLTPREGPAGWRSVVASPEGGELALWQPKQRVVAVAA